VQSVKLPDGNIKVLVEGVERARSVSITVEEGFFRATVRLLSARIEPSPQVQQLVEKITSLYEQFIKAFAEPELRHHDCSGPRR